MESTPRSLRHLWAKQLRDRRLDADLSQAELAHRAGISVFELSRAEGPDHALGPRSRTAVAVALGMAVADLFPYPRTLRGTQSLNLEYDGEVTTQPLTRKQLHDG